MLSVFVLSNCSDKDSKDGKEECDKKGADWIWDEVNKKCSQVTVGLSDKEKCEAKGAGWTWNETSKQCKTSYMTITVPNTTVIDEIKELTFSLYFLDALDVDAPLDKIPINPGECVKVHNSHVSEITIELIYKKKTFNDEYFTNFQGHICGVDPLYRELGVISPCTVGSYKVVRKNIEGTGIKRFILEKLSEIDVNSCREISPEYEYRKNKGLFFLNEEVLNGSLQSKVN